MLSQRNQMCVASLLACGDLGNYADPMTQIARLLSANESYAAARATVADPRPSRRLAVVTCMDARIDVFAALGLHLGEAHVIRNAGGRVTEDVLRSLALSSHVLGTDTIAVMQHTKCGLEGVSDEDLRARTGADLGFLPIGDHVTALKDDVGVLASTDFLQPLRLISGFVYDVVGGGITELVRWERSTGLMTTLDSAGVSPVESKETSAV